MCCPVCNKKKAPKKNHKKTNLYFSVVSIAPERKGLGNILICKYTRKQYFILAPLLVFSWADVAASIFQTISVNGVPEEFRYIRDDSVLLSDEEKNESKAGSCEDVEATVVNYINILNPNISGARTWGKSRSLGTIGNFKEGADNNQEFCNKSIGRLDRVYFELCLLVKATAPTTIYDE